MLMRLPVLNYAQSATQTTEPTILYKHGYRRNAYKPSQEILCILNNHTYKYIHSVQQKKLGPASAKQTHKNYRNSIMIQHCSVDMVNR